MRPRSTIIVNDFVCIFLSINIYLNMYSKKFKNNVEFLFLNSLNKDRYLQYLLIQTTY